MGYWVHGDCIAPATTVRTLDGESEWEEKKRREAKEWAREGISNSLASLSLHGEEE